MNTNFEKVIELLRLNGYDYQILSTGTRGAILVLPSYGRVLGLWCDKQAKSIYWINPGFLKRGSEKDESGWVNLGGHRIWIAPEREFFIGDLSRPFDTYKVPASVDPGQYEIEFESNQLTLKNKGKIRAFNSNEDVTFRLTRQIKALDKKFMEDIVGDLDLYAVQFFCGAGLGFGELEIHSPVLNNGDGYISKSRLSVYAFMGELQIV